METTTLFISLQFMAASTVHNNRGFPPNSLMFLRGMDLLPPLAGMNAVVLIGDYCLGTYLSLALCSFSISVISSDFRVRLCAAASRSRDRRRTPPGSSGAA